MPGSMRLQAMAHRRLRVGEHVIDIGSLRLLDSPDGQRLTPKSAAVLLELAARRGQTISRNELLDTVWAGTCPTPDVLTQAITDLRRVLGDESHAPRYIETVPKLGYRLVAEVAFSDAIAPADEVAGTPAVATAARGGAATTTRAILAGIAVVVIGVALGVTWLLSKPPAGAIDARAPTWAARALRTLTADPGAEKFPRIAPDGTRLAYSASDASQRHFRLLVRTLEQARPLRLGVNEDGQEFQPAWSPDGGSIAFLRYSGARCDIILAPAMGGLERKLRACLNDEVNLFAWAPAGDALVTTRFTDDAAGSLDIALVSLDGSVPRALPKPLPTGDKDVDPRYSPDGRWIAFQRGARPYTDLWIVAAEGGSARRITRLASRMRGYDWVRDGSALLFSSNHEGRQALYVVDIDDARVQALGVQPAEYPSAATASDSVVYAIPRLRTQLREVRLREGEASETDILATTANDSAPAISPVDARLAFVSDRSGAPQLWLHDPATASVFALTDYENATLADPAWRADGQRILVTVRGVAGGSGLVEIDPVTRAQRVLTAADDDVRHGTWGAVAGEVLAVVADADGEVDLVALRDAGGAGPRRRVLVEGVGRAEADPVTGSIYFTRLGGRGLHRLDPATGKTALVTVATPRFHVDGWRIASGNIVYVSIGAADSGELRSLDPATGDDWVLASLPDLPVGLDFSVSANGDRIVLAHVAADDTDLATFKLERAMTAAKP